VTEERLETVDDEALRFRSELRDTDLLGILPELGRELEVPLMARLDGIVFGIVLRD
jgi:hypothetical protein